jgi:hypothetical protein
LFGAGKHVYAQEDWDFQKGTLSLPQSGQSTHQQTPASLGQQHIGRNKPTLPKTSKRDYKNMGHGPTLKLIPARVRPDGRHTRPLLPVPVISCRKPQAAKEKEGKTKKKKKNQKKKKTTRYLLQSFPH